METIDSRGRGSQPRKPSQAGNPFKESNGPFCRSAQPSDTCGEPFPHSPEVNSDQINSRQRQEEKIFGVFY